MLDGLLCANSDDARKAVSLMLGPHRRRAWALLGLTPKTNEWFALPGNSHPVVKLVHCAVEGSEGIGGSTNT